VRLVNTPATLGNLGGWIVFETSAEDQATIDMNDDILTEKLLYYSQHGNIDMERCVEIAQAANDALVEHSRGGKIPQLAAAMVRCCLNDEDEAAYFRCAVDSLLQEKWGATPKDSAVLTTSMDMTYQGIWKALGDENEELDEPEPSNEDDASEWHHTSVSPFDDLGHSDSTTLDDSDSLRISGRGVKNPALREIEESMAQYEADCKMEKTKSLRRLAIFAVSGILSIGVYYIIQFFA